MRCDPSLEALPEWMRFKWPVYHHLTKRLGDAGVHRLAQLMDEAGDLTPPEARHWFELDRSQ